MTRTLPQPALDAIDVATVLYALADPVRLTLVFALSRHHDPQTCSLQAYDIDITAPTLSHHWRVLREAGLTTTTAQGRTRWVELRKREIEARFPGLLDAVLVDKRREYPDA